MNSKQCLLMIEELQKILDIEGECITWKNMGICTNLSSDLNTTYFTT